MGSSENMVPLLPYLPLANKLSRVENGHESRVFRSKVVSEKPQPQEITTCLETAARACENSWNLHFSNLNECEVKKKLLCG
jgi:hypothetical protein